MIGGRVIGGRSTGGSVIGGRSTGGTSTGRSGAVTGGRSIAGAVIGGTLLSGGSGTVVGAFIGALFLGILKDGLILQGVNANYLLFYSGLAIVVAMTANVFVGRARRGHTGLG